MSLSEKLAANLSNRKWLVSRLRAEIVGPDPSGPESDIRVGGASEDVHVGRIQEAKATGKWRGGGLAGSARQSDSAPVSCFLSAPSKSANKYVPEKTKKRGADIDPGENQNVDEKLEQRAERKAAKAPVAMDESEDYEVTLANAFRPSAIGLELRC
jgi:hypothetical protein